jgi:hypothetical protein
MKKIIGIVLLVFVFMACDLGSGNNGNNNIETITINDLSIKTTGIKSLYVSNIPVNSSSKAVSGPTIQTLSYINNDGQNTPFFFVSSSGKNIVLNVNSLQQLDDKRILVRSDSYSVVDIAGNTFTITGTGSLRYSFSGSGYLIDFEKNRIYDFIDWNIKFIHNDIIYASGNNYTIYKIDINNISTAIPLNNSDYFKISSIKSVVFGNKIIEIDHNYVIDINNAYPITKLKDTYITNEMCSFIPTGNPYKVDFVVSLTGLTFKDLTGNVWFFVAGGKTPGLNTYNYHPDFGNPDKYFFGKINIDNDGQAFLTDCVESSFSFTPTYTTSSDIFVMNSAGNSNNVSLGGVVTNTIIIICDDGFITMTRKANGIQVESTALSINLPESNYYGKSFIQNNYLYYLDNTIIKRIHLSTGSSVETIYSNSRILTSGSVSGGYIYPTGDNIIFYQFADDDNTTINTYSLPMYQQNPTPKLLSTSSANIRDIVELNF